jgi:hypothetical protein
LAQAGELTLAGPLEAPASPNEAGDLFDTLLQIDHGLEPVRAQCPHALGHQVGPLATRLDDARPPISVGHLPVTGRLEQPSALGEVIRSGPGRAAISDAPPQVAATAYQPHPPALDNRQSLNDGRAAGWALLDI